MSICSPGYSQPRSGLSDTITVTGPFAASALEAEFPWLAPFVWAFTGVATAHLPTFCASDPPADPGLTASDIIELVGFMQDPVSPAINSRIQQAIMRGLWYLSCECAGGGSITPPTPTTPPTGLPSVNPTSVVHAPVTVPCYVYSRGAFPSVLQNQGFSFNGWYPDSASTGLSPAVAALNITSARITARSIPGSPAAGPCKLQLTWYETTISTPTRADVFNLPNDGVARSYVTIRPTLKSGLDTAYQYASSPNGSGVLTDITVEYFCNNDIPGGTQDACCPPDPTQTGLLQQILSLVTLIQRQVVPFGYVLGTGHAGLTGTGTVAVSDILGVVATLTTVPSQLGDEIGTPPRLFDVGWLSLGTSDGYEAPRFIESASQLIVPRGAGLVTSVGYSLHSGVVLTLQELLREP